MWSPRCARPAACVGAAILCLSLPGADGATSSNEVVLDTYGGSSSGPSHSPVPISPSAFLIGVIGADHTRTSPDDVTLVVTDVGGSAVITPLSTPNLSGWSSHPERLSATRYLVIGGGQNEKFANYETGLGIDDVEVVHLLDRVGSENLVTTIPVGNLEEWGHSEPLALSATTAVIRTSGPDNAYATADDTVTLLTDLGGANTVIELAAPYTRESGSRPVALSPTSFVIGANGPDGVRMTDDDVMYLFTDVGGANTRTSIPVPNRMAWASGHAVRLSSSRILVCSAGNDHAYRTADDEMLLIEDLDTSTPSTTTIPITSIMRLGGGRPLPLDDDTVVLATAGPDETPRTSDDALALVTGLGTTNAVTYITVDFLDDNAAAQPVRLSDTACALASCGPDGNWGRDNPAMGADDEVVVVSGIGSTNTVERLTVPGLTQYAASEIVPLSSTAFMVAAGGADGNPRFGDDDCVHVVTNVPDAPAVETLDLHGSLNDGRACQPEPLGRGRAVLVAGGNNIVVASNDDDVVQILEGLPGADVRGLTAQKIDIQWNAKKPQKPTRVAAKALLLLDGLPFQGDVTVSIGNAAQTLSAAAFTRSRKGVVTYKDRKRRDGFLSKFAYDPRNGKLVIAGKGNGTAAETTSAAFMVLAIEFGNTYLSDSGAGQEVRRGLKYRPPK